MIIVRPEDVYHKVCLLRLLSEIADSSAVAASLYFKGGTCASMLGFLDRFSVDLDFDLKSGVDQDLLRKRLGQIFTKLELEVKTQSQKTLSFLLKYQGPPGQRNTIKINALPVFIKSNRYEPQYLAEIDRILVCQTLETMFANKLVTPLDRFKKYHSIAGRDFYDIHHFFLKGYRYAPAVVEERTGLDLKVFFAKLIRFVEERVTQTIIDEDLNTLLPDRTFQKIKKILKTETLMLLKNELARLNS